ncbi:hypothetical protein ACFFRR_008737 [Megaselia abdita]
MTEAESTQILGEWKRLKFGDEIPSNAVKGGYEKNGEPLYIGRATDWKNYCGKVSPSQGCFIPERGVEKRFTEFEILTNVEGMWVPVFDGNEEKPTNALKITDYDGEDVYSGRYLHQGSLVLGKVFRTKTFISYRGIEWNYSKNYEIFTVVPKNFTLKSKGHSKFLRKSGDYIVFRLKTSKFAQILLGTRKESLFEVCLSNKNSFITDYKNSVFKETSNLCNEDEYTGFWIHMKNGLIKVGKESQIQPIISLETETDLSVLEIVKFESLFKSEWNIPDYEEFEEVTEEMEFNYT